MFRIKIILIIIGVAMLATVVSLFFKSEGSLIGNVAGSMINRGFPGHFLESYQIGENPTNSVSNKFLWLNFLLDILLYTITVSSFYYLIQRGRKNKKWWLLAISIVLSMVWFISDTARTSECVGGFPIAFRNICGGDSNIASGFITFGTIFDILFWFCLSSIFIVVLDLLNSEKVGKWRYLIAPIFISLMSFWYNTPCTGMFCIFAGRGFPLPFYIDNNLVWIMLGIDFLLWALILYPLCRLVFRFFKKKLIK